MQIAQVLAGYSGLEADELRKAMAKKKPEIMLHHRQKFMEGAQGRGIDPATAQRVFELIEKFGGYGFNKSHSTAYAFVSYQTSYLKAHYPAEYMAALMTIYMNDQDRLVEYINECRRMGLQVSPPDINLSDSHFTPYDDHILFGLSAVRNVGSSVVEQVIACRDEGGPFTSLMDYCERVPPQATNRKTLESLIKAGAFDSVEGDRSLLLAAFEDTVRTAQRRRKEKEEGQFSLFGEGTNAEEALNAPVSGDYAEVPRRELLAYEKEMLGVYVSDHPLSEMRDDLYGQTDIEIAQVSDDMDKATLTVGGLITGLERRINKAGKEWAVFVLEDFSGSIEVLVFYNRYERLRDSIRDEAIVLVKGRVDTRDRARKLLAEEIVPLKRGAARPSCLVLQVDCRRFAGEMTSHIKEVLLEHPGEVPVRLSLHEENKGATEIKFGDLYSVETESDLIAKLKSLLGETAVKIEYHVY